MNPTAFFIFTTLLKIVGIVFFVILSMVSYAVYAERKVSALIQDRLGPNRVGPAGLFQPIGDAMKFLLNEDFTPAHVNKLYYWLAPCLAMVPAITTIAVVPFGSTLFGVPMVIADINVGVLIVRSLCHRRLRGNKPAALRPARGGNGIGRRLSHRIRLDEVRPLFPRGIRCHDYRLRHYRYAFSWGLAFSGRR